MASHNSVRVNRRFAIPESELEYRATRSGGPGGQHANTSATRIELTWNVRESRALSERRRSILLNRLANRIDGNGIIRVVSDTHRSQHQNRKEATQRLVDLVAKALRPRKKRKPTRPSKAANERRIRAKKRRGRKKKLRGRVRPDEE